MLPFLRRFLLRLVLSLLVVGTTHAAAAVATIDELFSNADGSIQFMLLTRTGDVSLAGHRLSSSAGGTTREYTFPFDAPAGPLSRSVLVATQGFAELGALQPDYIVPSGFLPLASGLVTLDEASFDYRSAEIPTDGAHALWQNPASGSANTYVAFAANAAGASHSFLRTPRISGLFWNTGEPGWGLATEQGSDVLYAAWATYDFDGSPRWFVLQRGSFSFPDDEGDLSGWSGVIFATTGSPFNADPFDASRVSAVEVGSATFIFPTPGQELAGRFDFRIEGASGRKDFVPAHFANPVPSCSDGIAFGPVPNYQGSWGMSTEPGWTLHLTHQGEVIFAVWFTYDASGKATWMSFTAQKSAPGSYAGTVYRSTGPSFNSTFNPALVQATAVGTAHLEFTDRSTGSFAYTVGGLSRSKAITRVVVDGPPTVCE
jgi:hypothetical protein